MATEPKIPELDKMRNVRDDSQKIGRFLDWFREEKGVVFAIVHEHMKLACYRDHECGVDLCIHRGGKCSKAPELNCGLNEGELIPLNPNYEALLADYFEIDLEKAEQERCKLLDYQRELNG